MAGFNPGQAFLGSVVNSATNIAQRDPLDDIKNDVDPNYLRNLEITSPGLFKDGKEEEPVDISDWLIPLDRAQGQYGPNVAMNLGGVKNIVGNAGNKVMQFLNQLNQGGSSSGAYRSDSERPGDFYTEFVPHPVTGEPVHPGVIQQYQRDQDLKFNRPMF